MISKTQIDRLGDRLRRSPLSEADLKALDEYRRSFGEAYEQIVGKIRDKLNLTPTGRPAKSTSSIIEKLHRESIRLSQVQDIAGCRVVVADIREQDRVLALLREFFPSANVIDRRTHPSYGYRAVHVVIKTFDKLIEVQIRTELQHCWAEVSEKLADKLDPAIKYGGGNNEIRIFLSETSQYVKDYESLEEDFGYLNDQRMSRLKKKIADYIKDFFNEK